MRILVVDDSEDWRDLTEAALLAAGYRQVATAESAVDAYSKLGLGRPIGLGAAAADLIVLDVVMPQIDGVEACARIRSDMRYVDVPVIMVTAADHIDALSSAFVAGATDYITKPFNRIELLARVRSALRTKAELDRRKSRESELTALMRSTWGDRDTSRFIDDATGFMIGAAAEAQLAAVSQNFERTVSVLAIAVDRLDALTVAKGKTARDAVLQRVAAAIGAATAPIAVTATSYPDGVFVVVAPQMLAPAARLLAQTLRTAVAALGAGGNGASRSGLSLSIGIVTARRARIELVADARKLLKEATAAGGNRIAVADLALH
jgi:PleD family two-component response regulator